jgi:hypothetical protein
MSTPPGTFTAQTIEPGPAERPGASHNPALREPIATDPSASRESRNDDVAEEHETAVGIGMRPVLGRDRLAEEVARRRVEGVVEGDQARIAREDGSVRELQPDGTPAEPSTLSAAVPNWRPGDAIYLGRRTLRVVAVRDDDADELPVLVVE